MWENAVQEDAKNKILLAADKTLLNRMRQGSRQSEQANYFLMYWQVLHNILCYQFIVMDASGWMEDKDSMLPGSKRMSVTLEFL
jgi:hypothetical protein